VHSRSEIRDDDRIQNACNRHSPGVSSDPFFRFRYLRRVLKRVQPIIEFLLHRLDRWPLSVAGAGLPITGRPGGLPITRNAQTVAPSVSAGAQQIEKTNNSPKPALKL
jgi:hypothetical protein